MNKKWIMMTVLGLGLAVPVGADEAKTEPPKDEPVKTEAPKPDEGGKAAELAARYKVPVEQVKDLRAKGLGWGEVGHALGIAQKAGVPLADVMKLRDSGLGWGKIAQNYGFKLGDVGGRKPEGGARERREERRELRHERREGPRERGGPKGGRLK